MNTCTIPGDFAEVEHIRKREQATREKLENYCFDDLHIIATGEFQNDLAAGLVLNLTYDFLKSQYIETLMRCRAVREVGQ